MNIRFNFPENKSQLRRTNFPCKSSDLEHPAWKGSSDAVHLSQPRRAGPDGSWAGGAGRTCALLHLLSCTGLEQYYRQAKLSFCLEKQGIWVLSREYDHCYWRSICFKNDFLDLVTFLPIFILFFYFFGLEYSFFPGLQCP